MPRVYAVLLMLVLVFAGCEEVDNSPDADIVSPGNSVITEGDTVNFVGVGDSGDRDVIGYEWISSIDGPLSANASFSCDNLSVGNHTIGFRIQNEYKWSSYATIWIRVDPRPPAVTLHDARSSDGTWRIDVVWVEVRLGLNKFRFDLQDESNVTQDQGEIAIQNNSGLVDGIESEDSWDEKNSGEADNETGHRAHDVENEADTCKADNETDGRFPVVFYDNDRDDKLTAGDQFVVRGSGYDANYTAEVGWKFVLRYYTGGVSGEVVLG